MYRCVGQLPSTCGVMRFRPPCMDGSSLVLARTFEAYRSWNFDGKGGRLEGSGVCFLFRVFRGCSGSSATVVVE